MRSIENTIEQVRRINERQQQMYTASAKLAAIPMPTAAVPPRLFDSINSASTLAKQFATIKMPTLPVQPQIFESVNSAKALAEQFGTIKMPTLPVRPELFESVNSANALAKRFTAIIVPTLKQNRKFSESLKFTKPITQYNATDRENLPILLSHRSIELRPKVALTRSTVRKPTPAEDVVTRIYKEFDSRLALEADRRHDVILVATLLTGKRLLVESLTTNGDHLIRIVGKANGEQPTEVVSGFASLQFEIKTIELRPSRPDLKIVH